LEFLNSSSEFEHSQSIFYLYSQSVFQCRLAAFNLTSISTFWKLQAPATQYVIARIIVQQYDESKCGLETPPESATPKLEATLSDEGGPDEQENWKWDVDPNDPFNWSKQWKVQQVLMIASAAFTTWAKFLL
jgi:hypothetical protein